MIQWDTCSSGIVFHSQCMCVTYILNVFADVAKNETGNTKINHYDIYVTSTKSFLLNNLIIIKIE